MGNKCSVEKWTIEDLSLALRNHHRGDKQIVVPMFQRGASWNEKQEKMFMDSVRQGFPVGTMLFYKRIEDNKEVYILVDGLQRGNTIKKYMTNPAKFYLDGGIPDGLCEEVLEKINCEITHEHIEKVKKEIIDFVMGDDFDKNVQYDKPAINIAKIFQSQSFDDIGKIIDRLKNFFEDKEILFKDIATTVIPVVVYEGNEDNLPEIFKRINSQGTALDKYEIYAAAWPVNHKFSIENKEIIEYVVKKYETLTSCGYTVDRYNREELRNSNKVNAFEYLFGLSKYLVNTFDILAFDINKQLDEVNSLAFELVNACVHESNKVRVVYKDIYSMDVNKFEKSLIKCINYIESVLSVIIRFKGNTRTSEKVFHSKFQILSMISTTFKEMYNEDFSNKSNWNEMKKYLSKNLVKYYIYDIITNYWSEGGNSKIHKIAKPNRYLMNISDRAWNIALDSYFENSMSRREAKHVLNPKNADYVLLNCIYLNSFTAMDQLSIEGFDVEHIAPKNQMKNLIEKTNGEGLPISCIANLCYLPEYVNRSKSDKNFYQDKKYLKKFKLKEIEEKYSFTDIDDLEWMDIDYQSSEDFPVLKEYYEEFCTARFSRLKKKIFNMLNVDCIEINEEDLEKQKRTLDKKRVKNNHKSFKKEKTRKLGYKQFREECIEKISNTMNMTLYKVENGVYVNSTKECGFLFTTSKVYKRAKGERFWYAYRKHKTDKIRGCKDLYYIFGCGNPETVVVLPMDKFEQHLEEMRVTRDEDGIISHYHIEFQKNKNGEIEWILSLPKLHCINISDKVI